ncbi:MAG: hypothetical protein HY369_01245 [Candidatus Aenigmarchaeota archaeon]|nr:hypothetical protein [Candidatus Aenigmarchaeota archaeon]
MKAHPWISTAAVAVVGGGLWAYLASGPDEAVFPNNDYVHIERQVTDHAARQLTLYATIHTPRVDLRDESRPVALILHDPDGRVHDLLADENQVMLSQERMRKAKKYGYVQDVTDSVSGKVLDGWYVPAEGVLLEDGRSLASALDASSLPAASPGLVAGSVPAPHASVHLTVHAAGASLAAASPGPAARPMPGYVSPGLDLLSRRYRVTDIEVQEHAAVIHLEGGYRVEIFGLHDTYWAAQLAKLGKYDRDLAEGKARYFTFNPEKLDEDFAPGTDKVFSLRNPKRLSFSVE